MIERHTPSVKPGSSPKTRRMRRQWREPLFCARFGQMRRQKPLSCAKPRPKQRWMQSAKPRRKTTDNETLGQKEADKHVTKLARNVTLKAQTREQLKLRFQLLSCLSPKGSLHPQVVNNAAVVCCCAHAGRIRGDVRHVGSGRQTGILPLAGW